MKHSAFNLNLEFTNTLYVILFIIGASLSVTPIQAQDNLKIKDASNNLIFEAKEIGVRVGDKGLGVESTFQLNSDAAGVPFFSAPWIYAQALHARSERGASGTAIILGEDGNRSEGDEIHLITNGDDRIVVKPDGGVGVGTNTPEPSAIMDVSSTSKGFLPPRMSTTERDAVANPASGLIIYNTTEEALQLSLGTIWVNLSTSTCQTPDVQITGGKTSVLPNDQGVIYSAAITNITTDSYNWVVPPGATIASGQGTNTITVDFGNSGGEVKVQGSNGCGWSSFATRNVLMGYNVTLPDSRVINVSHIDISTQWAPSSPHFYGNIGTLPDFDTASEALQDFSGDWNTQVIYYDYEQTSWAAMYCEELVKDGYDDWYLPSQGELKAIYDSLGPNGTNYISSGTYWSSTEKENFYAWGIQFSNGASVSTHKTNENSCRCVRNQ